MNADALTTTYVVVGTALLATLGFFELVGRVIPRIWRHLDVLEVAFKFMYYYHRNEDLVKELTKENKRLEAQLEAGWQQLGEWEDQIGALHQKYGVTGVVVGATSSDASDGLKEVVLRPTSKE